ncbi:MAG: hypothetical protein DWQ42_19550 [Planctomycetota bacterium]|nr:MAG: hypothetical protein DWQ42_19550 [Planctomycetota bacterium]REK37510.1 MAG: hypothetical protein DWQ46_22030 [Planctomycetota bacterium]
MKRLSSLGIGRLLSHALVLSVVTSFARPLLADDDRADAKSDPKLPNVILMMTDNHGQWTLGCYGNPEIQTPHIDRLAAGGMLFEHAWSNNAVCSPTRASWLSGLMPSQHGVHRFLTLDVMMGPKAYSTLEEFKSLPEVLADAGYHCGLVGKWHLGGHMTPQEGFKYWVTKTRGHTASFYNDEIIEDGKVRRHPEHITPFWTEHAKRFLDESQQQAKPFFLFLSYNGPYSLGSAIQPEPKNKFAELYADLPMSSFPRAPMHPWMASPHQRQHVNNVTSMRNMASQISMVDESVGEVLAKLAELGLENDTIVVFTADQGTAGGHGGFWGMGDHTRPLTARDQCMQIPLIIRYPGHIPAGRKVDEHVANYDFYPTLLNYLGLEERIPAEPPLPGRDFSPLLRGEEIADWDNTVFYDFETIRVIRTPEWKYVERIRPQPNSLYHMKNELYDLTEDPAEATNLFDKSQQYNTTMRLRKALFAFFDKHADPKWDLWNGGGYKGGLLMGQEAYRDGPNRAGLDE